MRSIVYRKKNTTETMQEYSNMWSAKRSINNQLKATQNNLKCKGIESRVIYHSADKIVLKSSIGDTYSWELHLVT